MSSSGNRGGGVSVNIWYGTYMLPSGRWQETAIFDNFFEAKATMRHHAQGRGYIIARSEKCLESVKREVRDEE